VVYRTIILVVVFSQFLRGLQVNFCVRIDGRWEERGFPFFGVFAVRTLRYVTLGLQRWLVCLCLLKTFPRNSRRISHCLSVCLSVCVCAAAYVRS